MIIPRCRIEFLMQSRHLLSFLISALALIWSESREKLLRNLIIFVENNLNTYFICEREGRDVGCDTNGFYWNPMQNIERGETWDQTEQTEKWKYCTSLMNSPNILPFDSWIYLNILLSRIFWDTMKDILLPRSTGFIFLNIKSRLCRNGENIRGWIKWNRG